MLVAYETLKYGSRPNALPGTAATLASSEIHSTTSVSLLKDFPFLVFLPINPETFG